MGSSSSSVSGGCATRSKASMRLLSFTCLQSACGDEEINEVDMSTRCSIPCGEVFRTRVLLLSSLPPSSLDSLPV